MTNEVKICYSHILKIFYGYNVVIFNRLNLFCSGKLMPHPGFLAEWQRGLLCAL